MLPTFFDPPSKVIEAPVSLLQEIILILLASIAAWSIVFNCTNAEPEAFIFLIVDETVGIPSYCGLQ